MGFLKWILGAIVIDPLIMLFIWNVIVTNMFTSTSKTEFGVCLIISIIINLIATGIKNAPSDDDLFSRDKNW